MYSSETDARTPRTVSPALLFVLSCMWIVVSLAGGRLAGTLLPAVWYDLGREMLTAAMLFAGFYLMARLGISDLRPLSSVGFVRRPGIAGEFGVGAALGWGISLLLVLPAVLSRDLTLTLHLDAAAMRQLAVSVLVLVVYALVMQLVLSGLPVRLLVRSVGSTWTVLAVLLVGIGLVVTSDAGQGVGVLFAGFALCLSLFAFLRTRAVWLPLGLQLGWTISLQLLFGAQSPYTPVTSSVVQSTVGGPAWLTGGQFGPEASWSGVAILAAALLVLFRLTRDYAWHYTYQPIVSAGRPMDVAPPAAHLKEAERIPAAAPLVQIGGIAPAPAASSTTSSPVAE